MKYRTGIVFILSAVAAAVGAQQTGPGRNWLLNPGAEAQPVTVLGWRQISGDWSRVVNGVAGAGGQAFFWGGDSPRAELTQDVSLTALGPWLAQGGKKAVFRGYLSSWKDDTDTSEVVLEVLGAEGNVLSKATTGPRNHDGWTEATLTVDLPSASAFLRLRLVAVRAAGRDNDGYFDDLRLYLVEADGGAREPPTARTPGATRIPQTYYGYYYTSGEITAADPVEDGYHLDTYEYAAVTGENLVVYTRGTDDGLRLVSPDGRILAEDDYGIEVVVPAAGLYTIHVAARPEKMGTYQFELLGRGRETAGRLDPVEDGNRRTREGGIYDDVAVDIEAGYWVFDLEQAFQGRLTLRDQRFAEVETTPDFVDGKLRQQAKIEEAGTYHLIIEGDDPAGGDWILTQNYRGAGG